MNRVIGLPRAHGDDLTVAMTFVVIHHHHLTHLDVRSKTQARIEALEVRGRQIEDHTFLGFLMNYVGIQVFPSRIGPRPRERYQWKHMKKEGNNLLRTSPKVNKILFPPPQCPH
ncbi:uncharacterized protein LOC126630367 isoform X2 [Malus sylvestris]|uniref:uncharacterized protein LOC126630367 isoform X2 n=1 Tax=Malus sylvestris TaxID=3752 RepID=UPI0021ACFE44|nr:uncharacterized protein LOC126630367 isoform X2 [Malus sylvestris]